MQRSCAAAGGFKLLPTLSTAVPSSSSLSLCDHLKPPFLSGSISPLFGLSARSGALNRSTFAAHFLRERGIAESDQDAVSKKTSSGLPVAEPPGALHSLLCQRAGARQCLHSGLA